MILLVLSALIVSLLAYVIHRNFSYWQRRGIPHDTPKFPHGNFHAWPKTKQFSHIFKDYYEKYENTESGPFAGFYFYFKRLCIITDLELVKNILIKDFNNFDNRGFFYNEIDDPLSATLISIEGHKWRQLRQKLTPTFTSGKMKHMFPTVLGVAQTFLHVFEQKVFEAGTNALEITDLVSRFTADVIGTCAFGLECNSLTNPKAEFVVTGRRAIVERAYGGKLDILTFGFPKFARKLRLRTTLPEIEDFYMRIICDTIAYRREHNIKRNDFMDMLMEMKEKYDAGNHEEGLSLNELAAQAFIFFVAGFETSSTTMGFALYELARHPAIQDKLRNEIGQVLAQHNNEFSYECMKKMVYLEQVIDETLRMYPHINRVAQKDYATGDPKYYIEAGTAVIISTLGIHYNAAIYPEPKEFKPERFTEKEIRARPACTWLPFGDGPRNCIGLRFGKMQICIGLAYLIKHFKFAVSAETEIPIKLDNKNILLNAINGIHLKVTKVL